MAIWAGDVRADLWEGLSRQRDTIDAAMKCASDGDWAGAAERMETAANWLAAMASTTRVQAEKKAEWVRHLDAVGREFMDA